MIFYKLDCNT